MNYELSLKAREDLESIWLYTAMTWSQAQADHYLVLMRTEIEHLSHYPLSGKDFSFARKGYRASKVKSHLIFYKIRKDGVLEIIRILHESMDFPERLED